MQVIERRIQFHLVAHFNSGFGDDGIKLLKESLVMTRSALFEMIAEDQEKLQLIEKGETNHQMGVNELAEEQRLFGNHNSLMKVKDPQLFLVANMS